MPDAYQLVIQQGPGQGQTYAVEQDELVIGRGIDCDLSIIDPSLSRHHARLYKKDERFYLEDLKSTNGTWLNDVQLTDPQPVDPGTRIRLGQNVILGFETASAEEVEKTMTFAPDVLKTAVGPAAKEATGMTASGSKVFISYSRRNKEFVQKLHGGLRATGMNVWVDWEGIPLTADWWQEIQDAIEGADGFVFVISPDSLASEVCERELQTAISSNKRLIPILHIDPEKGTQIPDRISSHNWVFMKNDDELRQNLPALVESINTDLTWVQAHTRLLVRAVEWLGAERRASLLLRGDDLERAEQMVAQSEAGKKPALNDQQLDYVRSSREEATRTRRRLMAGLSVMAVITVLLIISILSFINATRQQAIAEEQQALAVTAQSIAEEQKVIAEEQRAIAEEQEAIAKDQQAIAEKNADEAKKERARAEESQRLALARGISAQAQVASSNFPPRAILLAAQSFRTRLDEGQPPLAFSQEVLRGAIAGIGGRPLVGHSNGAEITVSAFHPDGITLASGDSFGDIFLWYPEDPESSGTWVFAMDGWEVSALVFSPDGNWMAAGADSGQTILFPLFFDDPFSSPIDLGFQNAGVTDLAFSPDGQWLASSSWDSTTHLWDLLTDDIPASLQVLENPDISSRSLAFNPDSSYLATGYDDGRILLWDIPNVRPDQVRAMEGHQGPILDLAFSPDGAWLASGGADWWVFLWNMNSGAPWFNNFPIYEGHQSDVVKVAFNADSTFLATADAGGAVRTWILDGNPTNDTIRYRGHKGRVTDLLFTPAGDELVSSSSDGTMRIWPVNDPDAAENALVLRGHTGAVTTLALSGDGRWLISSGEDALLRAWDLSRPDPAAGFGLLSAHSSWISDVVFSPDGRWLATGGFDNLIFLWDVDSADPGNPAYVLSGHSDWVRDLEFSPDGRFLASASDDSSVGLWDMNALDQGGDPTYLPGDGSYLYQVAFSPDGRWLAAGSLTGQVLLRDLESGEQRSFSFENEMAAILFSPDSRWLAAASWDGQTRLIDVENGFAEVDLSEQGDVVIALAFSPDNRWLATGSINGTIFLWNLAGESISVSANLNVHTDWVRDLDFSPDSSQLVSGSDDANVIVWNINSRTPENDFTVLFGHEDWVKVVAFSPVGTLIASGSDDATIRLWDIFPEDPADDPIEDAIVLRGHEGFIDSLAFSPDGRWVASGAADFDVRLWPLETSVLLEVACASAGRNLTQEEWDQFVGKNEPYTATCDAYPSLGRAQEEILEEEAYEKLVLGDVQGAVADFSEIQTLNAEYLDVYDYSNICWFGGLWNEAEIATAYCDLALELAPDDGFIVDSRGLVRALLGDLEGAAADFRYAVSWAVENGFADDAFTSQRSDWADQLEAGVNPFDEALLEELRTGG